MSPVATCATCGAHLSIDHLRGTDCPYCRTAFPHHARAVEHAAVVNQVLAQNMVMAQNMAAAWTAAIPTVVPFVQVDQAMRRTQQAIAMAVGVAIAIGVLGVVLCAVFLA